MSAWIEWTPTEDSKSPVPPETRVAVKFRHMTRASAPQADGIEYDADQVVWCLRPQWKGEPNVYDVVAYMVVE